MLKIKIGFLALAVAVVAAPSFAEAQLINDRSTRNGAIAGAIIGGIIGDQDNNAFTGAVIGGLVGGAAGNHIGRTRGFYGTGYNNFRPVYGGAYGYGRGYGYGGGFGYAPSVRVYSSNFYGGRGYGYGGRGYGYGGRGYCPNRGW